MDEEQIISRAMSILGKRTSERKKASSRANALRPRRTKELFVFEWPRSTITRERYSELSEREKVKSASKLIKLAMLQSFTTSKELCPKCERCDGAPGYNKIIAHHPDYSKPMEVELMCATCHTKLHRVSKRLAKSPKTA